jgi:hypothetical protein
MKKLLLLGFAGLVAACTSIKTVFDYDTSASFASYKTYNFTPESQHMGMDALNAKRVFAAIETELAAKGMTKADSPDVMVDVHLKTQERVEAVANTTGTGYRGYYGGVGISQTTVNYHEYTDGSLFITMFDTKTKALVWQGIGSKTLEEDASAEKREKMINYTVKKILYNYPPKGK